MVIVIQGGREMAWNFGKIWDLSKTKVAKKNDTEECQIKYDLGAIL